MRGGKGAKEKGSRFERHIVHEAQKLGLKAYRHFLSRSPTSDACDIVVAGREIQCKKKADGFKTLRKWLEGVDALALGADRSEPLIVIRLKDWLKLI